MCKCFQAFSKKWMHNKSLHWIFTLLRSVKTSELNRWLHPSQTNEKRGVDAVLDGRNDLNCEMNELPTQKPK